MTDKASPADSRPPAREGDSMDRRRTGARAALAASVLAGALALSGCGGITFGKNTSATPSAAQGTTSCRTDPRDARADARGTRPTTPATTTTTPSPTTTTVKPKPTSKPTPPKPQADAHGGRHAASRATRAPTSRRSSSGSRPSGYWNGSADGVYGGLTSQAVMALQKAAGLGRDGVLGPATRRALQNGVRPQSPHRWHRHRDRQVPPAPARRPWRQGHDDPQHEHRQRRAATPARARPGSPRPRRAPSAPSARSTTSTRVRSATCGDRATSTVGSRCTGRATSPVTPPRTAARASATRRWT